MNGLAQEEVPGAHRLLVLDWAAFGRSIGRLLTSRISLIVLGLLLGYAVFSYALGGVPQVAVIDGPTDAIDLEVAQEIGTKLRLAADDRRVKAVVLRVDSPGGFVSASEDLFTNVLHLRQQKPVVVVVEGLAASGAYFTAVAANHIVAKGSSSVGNVGAILSLPSEPRPSQETVSTGPFKLTGGSQRTYLKLLELVKDEFAEAVLSQRQGRLRITRDELLEGRIYLGVEAVQLGLVDELGTQVDAVRRAAKLAGLRRYEVVRLEEKYRGRLSQPSEEGVASEAPPAQKTPNLEAMPSEFPFIYYLFVPP